MVDSAAELDDDWLKARIERNFENYENQCKSSIEKER
jgi:hypothetical protein